jgi:hypothetical protein
MRAAVDAGISGSSVPNRCQTPTARKKKARRSGLEMVAGPGFEIEGDDTDE